MNECRKMFTIFLVVASLYVGVSGLILATNGEPAYPLLTGITSATVAASGLGAALPNPRAFRFRASVIGLCAIVCMTGHAIATGFGIFGEPMVGIVAVISAIAIFVLTAMAQSDRSMTATKA